MEAASTEPGRGPGTRRGVAFVLFAHPAVQLLRFGSKVALAWFLTSEDLGEAVFAGVFAFLAGQIAVWGLDEVLVQAPVLDARSWRSARRWHGRTGAVVGATLVVLGLAAGSFRDHLQFGALLAALGPMVWLANHAVLPTALLVRNGAYRAVFVLDLAQAAALAAGTLIPAALGLGPFSLVLGWYANALVAVVVSERAARPWMPAAEAAADDRSAPAAEVAWPATRRLGGHFLGASLTALVAERLDVLVVGARLGRAALGLFELAQQVSTSALGYTTNLVERLFFPVLADAQRAERLGPALREALRIVFVFLIPLHVAIAAAGPELVRAIFPAGWQAAAPLVALLALAAGARALDLVACAALKADGRGRTVAALGWARLALLAAALAAGLPRGLEALAVAVFAVRALAAVLSTFTAVRAVARGAGALGVLPLHALFVFGAWSAALLAFAVRARGEHAPGVFLLLVLGTGLGAWALLRFAFDRPGLARELAWLRGRREGVQP